MPWFVSCGALQAGVVSIIFNNKEINMPKSKDPINPSYYKDKDIETIDAIESQVSPIEFLGFLRCSALQYLMRMGNKPEYGKSMNERLTIDAGKAAWMIDRLIKFLTKCKKNGYKFEHEELPNNVVSIKAPKPGKE
tara:strand:- start:1 stop:408 length:408 start_codon:yes stop_codon:yes gene_type:complete